MNPLSHEPPKPAPQWMLNEVVTGLQQMLLLNLPGTPAAETIGGAAQAWAPKAILEAMPNRPPQLALPEPEISDEQRRRNLRRISQIMTDALNKRKVPPPKPKHQDSGAATSLTLEQEEALLAEAWECYKDVPNPAELT